MKILEKMKELKDKTIAFYKDHEEAIKATGVMLIGGIVLGFVEGVLSVRRADKAYEEGFQDGSYAEEEDMRKCLGHTMNSHLYISPAWTERETHENVTGGEDFVKAWGDVMETKNFTPGKATFHVMFIEEDEE